MAYIALEKIQSNKQIDIQLNRLFFDDDYTYLFTGALVLFI